MRHLRGSDPRFERSSQQIVDPLGGWLGHGSPQLARMGGGERSEIAAELEQAIDERIVFDRLRTIGRWRAFQSFAIGEIVDQRQDCVANRGSNQILVQLTARCTSFGVALDESTLDTLEVLTRMDQSEHAEQSR